jgi:hypothetical protein
MRSSIYDLVTITGSAGNSQPFSKLPDYLCYILPWLGRSQLLKNMLHLLWGVDYEKPMRTWHKHSCAQWSTGWVWHQPQKRARGKMQHSCFSQVVYVQRSRNAGFSCYMSYSSLRTVAPPPYSLKEDAGFFDGGFWLAGCSLLASLLREWPSCCWGWIMLEIRENMGQCKFEGQDSKKDYAKENLTKTWDNASLRKGTWKNRKKERL